MSFKSSIFQNWLTILIIASFAFASFIPTFFKQNYILEIGNRFIGNKRIKQEDLLAFGATKENVYGILDYLIINAVLELEAEDLGIVVAEQDIQNRIKEKFTIDNKFDQKSLNDYLSKNNISKNSFITIIKNEILRNQLCALIKVGVRVPKEFVKKFTKGISKQRYGYYRIINSKDLTNDELIKFGHNPSSKDFNRIKAASDIASTIEKTLLDLDSSEKKMNYVKTLDSFKHVKGVSIESCFQNSKDDKKNDCLCEKCFKENNALGVTREVAIMLLASKENSCSVYEKKYISHSEFIVCIPIGSEYPENSELEEYIHNYFSYKLSEEVKSAYLNALSQKRKRTSG